VVNATCLLGEKGCYKNGKCHYIGNCEHKVLTNADRIRAMSDEELRDFLQSKVWLCETHKLCDTCTMYDDERGCLSLKEWLKQPAE
jgi:hypothetical protein